MKLELTREAWLTPLQRVMGAVERRQTKPVLGHVLIQTSQTGLRVAATDLEIELIAEVPLAEKTLEAAQNGSICVPARKLFELLRALPEGSTVDLESRATQAMMCSGRSRFTLATLPAEDFPLTETMTTQPVTAEPSLVLAQHDLKTLFEGAAFAMAQNDVRYYLNGLLLEWCDSIVQAVATDGHRLALCQQTGPPAASRLQVIVPRKGVIELTRLLETRDSPAQVTFSANHIRVRFDGLQLTSKLIDGRFPDYERVLGAHHPRVMRVVRHALSQALSRAAILSNEKHRGVRLELAENTLKIQAQNTEHEEAIEELEVRYQDEPLEIGFNVAYLMDVLNVISAQEVEIHLSDNNSSGLIKAAPEPVSETKPTPQTAEPAEPHSPELKPKAGSVEEEAPSAGLNALYVIMPMRL